MRIQSLQNLVSPSHNSFLVLESVGQEFGQDSDGMAHSLPCGVG